MTEKEKVKSLVFVVRDISNNSRLKKSLSVEFLEYFCGLSFDFYKKVEEIQEYLDSLVFSSQSFILVSELFERLDGRKFNMKELSLFDLFNLYEVCEMDEFVKIFDFSDVRAEILSRRFENDKAYSKHKVFKKFCTKILYNTVSLDKSDCVLEVYEVMTSLTHFIKKVCENTEEESRLYFVLIWIESRFGVENFISLFYDSLSSIQYLNVQITKSCFYTLSSFVLRYCRVSNDQRTNFLSTKLLAIALQKNVDVI